MPRRIQDRLNSDALWAGRAQQFMENIDSYLGQGAFFFPEYTAHGFPHAQNVLALCDKLIPDDALDAMSARELAVLVIALLGHDLGMFIEKDGLHELLFEKYRDQKNTYGDDSTWGEEWEKYSNNARHYPSNTLRKLFGSDDPFTVPPQDMNAVTHRDKLVYGDFLRKHHPRLSQFMFEIGFPGSKLADIVKNLDFDDDMRRLLGIIVRSHGMELRDTEGMLENHFGELEKPLNISVYYLMSILRIADYLDAGEDRAPHSLVDRQRPVSPLSLAEHSWNQCLDKERNVWHTHKEKLVIYADPKDPTQFLQIHDWLKSVQSELDMCWAVLGERYPRDAAKSLSIRRITSDILEPKSRKRFEEKFVTTPVSLRASSDLLPLLTGPLYGDNPSYGVRELLANAVDACNEREALEREAGNTGYVGKITVELDTKKQTFTITDNGIGMTAETLRDYYLVAGASFRNSTQWKQDFTEGDTTKITRSGQFGIGILATFLLGDSAKVSTRHMRDSRTLNFTFALNQENINITKSDDGGIGTKITIQLNPGKCDRLIYELQITNRHPIANWTNWYYRDIPRIEYTMDGSSIEIKHSFTNGKWHTLESDDSVDIRWSTDHHFSFYNNFRLENIGYSRFESNYGADFIYPALHIEDRKNGFSLNLHRTVISHIPFKKQLVSELLKYAIARMVNHTANSKKSFPDLSNIFNSFDSSRFIVNLKGYTLNNDVIIKKIMPERILFASLFEYEHGSWESRIPLSLIPDTEESILLYYQSGHLYPVMKDFHEYIFSGITLTNSLLKQYIESDIIDIGKYIITDQDETATSISVDGSTPSTPLDVFEKSKFSVLLEFTLKRNDNMTQTLFDDLIDYYFGDDIWIPFDLEERKKKFPKIFSELGKYM